jgi:hypothetical protein
MQVENSSENLIKKEKAQWNRSWVGLLKAKVSKKPIIAPSLFAIPNNKVMYTVQIFQYMSKQMLETTYT